MFRKYFVFHIVETEVGEVALECSMEESGEVETEEGATESQEIEGSDEADIMEWARKLGYKKMGLDVFNKLQVI